MPILTESLLKLSGLQEWLQGFRDARLSENGENIRTVQFKDFQVGAIACSEVMSPSIVSKQANLGSAFIINAASHSVFNGSYVLHGQTLNMAKVRAVENNRYYLQSANFVPSFVISNKGTLLGSTKWFAESVYFSEVEVITAPSVYNQFGRATLAISILLLVALAVIRKYFPEVLSDLTAVQR